MSEERDEWYERYVYKANIQEEIRMIIRSEKDIRVRSYLMMLIAVIETEKEEMMSEKLKIERKIRKTLKEMLSEITKRHFPTWTSSERKEYMYNETLYVSRNGYCQKNKGIKDRLEEIIG